MKTVHTELLEKFAGVLHEMNLLCEKDSEFEDLLCTLNYNQTVFGSSVDEMACEVDTFIEEYYGITKEELSNYEQV